MGHPYIPNDTETIRRRMLEVIGVENAKDVFSDIPSGVRFERRLDLPAPRSEYEARSEVECILAKNRTEREFLSFLGGGVWSHIVPAAVDSIAGRAEFVTSYTPYQPEISQGMLQALYEYQSLICELLDMDIANASMYDFASAVGEAARMACRVTGRRRVLYPHFISPNRLSTLRTYTKPCGIELVEVKNDVETGQLCIEDLKHKASSETAALYIENPSYFGTIATDAQGLSDIVHDKGGLLIVGVDPTSLGILKPPGQYEADVAVGEGQPLGSYVNFGGPLLGLFACREETRLIRQMPGRIIGMTRTKDGETGYCMVLQTREQHIRREKATSNICTNEALLAIRAAVYISLLGPTGLRRLGEYLASAAQYAVDLLSKLDGIKAPLFRAPHFKEFTVALKKDGLTIQQLNARLLERGIIGGHDLTTAFPEVGDASLFCVTERHTGKDIEKLASCLADVLEA